MGEEEEVVTVGYGWDKKNKKWAVEEGWPESEILLTSKAEMPEAAPANILLATFLPKPAPAPSFTMDVNAPPLKANIPTMRRNPPNEARGTE